MAAALLVASGEYYSVSSYLFTLVFSCYLAFVIYKRRRYVAMVDKVAGPRARSFLGNLDILGIRKEHLYRVPRVAVTLQNMYGITIAFAENGLHRIWLGTSPGFGISRYKTAEIILSSNTLIGKADNYFTLRPWLGTGLLTSTGLKWKTRRKLLTPAFHFRILEDFLCVINDQCKILTDKLQGTLDSEWTDMVPFMTMCTLDIIGETAMGVCINAQSEKNSHYVKNIHELGALCLERGNRPWLWNDFIFYRTSFGKRFSKSLNIVHQFTRQVIRQKKASFEKLDLDEKSETLDDNLQVKKKRLAFIDILLNEHMKDNNFTEEDIREEVDTFLFEGHDTTAVGISWALYLIGLHPDVQQKIYDELESIFGEDVNKHVTSDDLKNMKYLECVLKESQRLYPSVPFIARQCDEELKINNCTIPIGSRMMVLFYAIHRDPEVFPEPEVFDPDRFSNDNARGRNPFAYVPFSAGPRNCIGQRFAIMEEKTVVANILRHFVVRSLDPRDKVIPSAELVLRPLNGIRMNLKKRR